MPIETAKRRGRPPKANEIKPEAIIEAALRSFATHGFEGASLRRIAAVANVDVALIAHRHGAKLELWKAVVDDIADKFVARLGRSRTATDATPGETSLERLMRDVDQFIDFAAQAPEMSMFIIKEVAQQDERFHYVNERLVRPAQDALMPTIERAIADGFLEQANADVLFYNLSGAIAMTVALRPFTHQLAGDPLGDEHFAASMKTLWRSLLGRPR